MKALFLITTILLLTACNQNRFTTNKAKNKINNILEKHPELITKFDSTSVKFDTIINDKTYSQTDTLMINIPTQIYQTKLNKGNFLIDNSDQKIIGSIDKDNKITIVSEFKPRTIIKTDTIKLQDTCINITKVITETKFVNNTESIPSIIYYFIKKNLIWILLFIVFLLIYNQFKHKSIY